jgi:hypothetical protein
MTPRFKGKPNFDFSLPCPLCGYKIQPNELMFSAADAGQAAIAGFFTAWWASTSFGLPVSSAKWD